MQGYYDRRQEREGHRDAEQHLRPLQLAFPSLIGSVSYDRYVRDAKEAGDFGSRRFFEAWDEDAMRVDEARLGPVIGSGGSFAGGRIRREELRRQPHKESRPCLTRRDLKTR